MRAVRTDLAFLELAHRLDRETSGCLLLAKNRIALNACHELFRQHTVTKIYQVVVLGRWPESLQMVDVALQKNSSQGGERKTTVSSQGKSAKTHFRVLEYYSSATLLEAKLETGRTHQIRVHTAHSGYPVIGDEKYGDKQFNQYARQNGIGRLLLHAYRLVFACPLTDKKIDIKSQRSLIKYEKSLNSL